MPIYVLRCSSPDCGAEEEFILASPDECPDKCRLCKSKLQRVFAGPPALRFKGSGFYATDYQKKEPTDDQD